MADEFNPFGSGLGLLGHSGLGSQQARQPPPLSPMEAQLMNAHRSRLAAQQQSANLYSMPGDMRIRIPSPEYPKTFQEELQKDTDEWLSGVLDLTGE